ncbi:X8 domain [Musa troglodytarum]|uniref:X8 domain n=1 Tax=Musa troglodytarum TaxID=320322 RepID=A0A9E7FQY0_9LILI|nr:X8 domain [Musa troglodytarum]
MAALASAVLMLAMIGGSEAAWCICKPELADTALQKTLDYACGAGADCTPILQNGACYSPNTVKDHCSYAVNSYYQRKAQAQQACDFSGTATLTTTDPSKNGCTYPSSPSAAGTSNSPPATSTPGTFTPTTGGLSGFGPTSSISTGNTNGGFLPKKAGMGSLLLPIAVCSGLGLLG